VASEAAERARADSWKTKATALVTELENVKTERDAAAKLLEDAETTKHSLEDLPRSRRPTLSGLARTSRSSATKSRR
jgi:hypothetical protein